MTATVPRLTYDTAGMTGGAAFETWRQSGWPGFGGAFEIGGDVSRFRYRAELAAGPRMAVSRIDIAGLTWRRPPGLARRDGRDQILLQWTERGGVVAGEVAGSPFSAGNGTVGLFDMAADVAQRSADTRAIHLLLSRDLFTGDQAEALTRIGLTMLGGAMLGGFMRRLMRDLPGASPAGAGRAERSAAAVLMACRTGDRDAIEEARPELEATAREHVRRLVRRGLTGDGVVVGSLAAAAGISRATLYRLFAADGGVGRFVQAERLTLARDALLNPDDRRPLAEIAQALGFADGPHLTRSFRERYGLRPSDFRPFG